MTSKRKNLIFIILLFMVVVSAAVTTTLVVNGILTIGTNKEDFGIYFSKSVLNSEDISKKSISTNGQKITFEAELMEFGQTAELNYEVTNASHHYDAKVSIECQFKSPNEESTINYSDYLKISFPNSQDIIPARRVGNGSITVTLKRAVVEEMQIALECNLDFDGLERDSLGVNLPEYDPSNYNFRGYLVNEEGYIIPDTNIVILDKENIYITTNEDAYLTIEGLDMGFYDIFIIKDKTIEEIKNMSNQEIKESALTQATFTQSSKEITFDNGYKIIDELVKKEYTLYFDTQGGSVDPVTKIVLYSERYGKLPIPTFDGYNFGGWYTDTEYTTPITENLKVYITSDMVLYAKWEAKTYTVNFNSDGGNAISSKTIKYSSNYGELESPIRKRYSFLGWYLNDTLVTEITKFTSLSDVTLIAKWGVKTKTIKVEIDGTLQDIEIDLTKPIIEGLPSTAKEGYDFEGWYKVPDNTKLTDGELLDEDEELTLRAIYSPKKYIVTFETNTESVDQITKEVIYDKTYGVLPSVTKEGYNFIGWFTDVTQGEQITEETTVKITKDATLYARWMAKDDIVYTVKHWKQNIGSNANDKNENNYTLAKTDVLLGQTDANITPNTNSYEGFTSPEKENLTVKADGSAEINYYYRRNSYLLTVNKNAGISNLSHKNTYFYEEDVNIKYTVNLGYTLTGITGDKKSNNFSMPANNVTITINTTENTYTITYNLNNGTISEENPSSYTVTSEDITLINPTRDGYTFTGWTGSNGETLDKNVTIAKGSIENKTYTANWEPKTYKVTFDANGGNTVNTVLTVTYDATYGNTLPTPTKEGYTFAGWYTSSNEGERITNTTQVKITENQTLYAHWTVNTYTISYVLNNGTAGTSQPTSANYDSVVTISNPTRESYTFVGWTVTSGLNTNTAKYGTSNTNVTNSIYSNTTKVTAEYFKNLTATNGGSVTLTANWIETSYSITYILNGGTNNTNNPSSYKENSNDITIQAPTRTGYTFAGWTGSNGTTNQTSVKIAKGSTGDKTYTANWTAKSYTVTLNAGTGGSISASSVSVNYGGTNTFIVTPNSGYYLSSIVCTNGYTTINAKELKLGMGTLTSVIPELYNKLSSNETSSQQTITVSNNNNDKVSTCTVVFTQTPLAYDGTSDNNLRYIGANPNNYVSFNGELWRIIGVMNNIIDSSGNKASHVKIVRNSTIGTYSWDNKDRVGSSITVNGSNDWSDSRLMTVLNSGPYWNRTSGSCPYERYNEMTSCNFSSTGLTSDARSKISSVVWNLGGYDGATATASTIYAAERGTRVYSGHKTTWTGRVAQMYSSDYGYAVGGNVRSTCLATNLSNYNYNSCYANDWLYLNSNQYVLTPYATYTNLVHMLSSNGTISSDDISTHQPIRPAVYLNTNIQVSGGSGTSSDPYRIN